MQIPTVAAFLNIGPFLIFSRKYIFLLLTELKLRIHKKNIPIVPYIFVTKTPLVFLLLCLIDGRSIIPFTLFSLQYYNKKDVGFTQKTMKSFILLCGLSFLIMFGYVIYTPSLTANVE